MARRILSADSVLAPSAQKSLKKFPQGLPEKSALEKKQLEKNPGAGLASQAQNSVRTESGAGLVPALESRWQGSAVPGGQALFDWEDRAALFTEIEFVNRARDCFHDQLTAARTARSPDRTAASIVDGHCPSFQAPATSTPGSLLYRPILESAWPGAGR